MALCLRFDTLNHTFLIMRAPPGESQTNPIFEGSGIRNPRPVTTLLFTEDDLTTLQIAQTGDCSAIAFARDNGYVRTNQGRDPMMETGISPEAGVLLNVRVAVRAHLGLERVEMKEFEDSLYRLFHRLLEKMLHSLAAAENHLADCAAWTDDIAVLVWNFQSSYDKLMDFLVEAVDVLYDPDMGGVTLFLNEFEDQLEDLEDEDEDDDELCDRSGAL